MLPGMFYRTQKLLFVSGIGRWHIANQLSLYMELRHPLEQDSVFTAHSGGLSSNYGVRDQHY